MENHIEDPLEEFIAAGIVQKDASNKDTPSPEDLLLQDDDPEPPSEDNDPPIHDDEDSEEVQAQYEFLLSTGFIQPPSEDYEFDGKAETLEELIGQSRRSAESSGINKLWAALSPEFQSVIEYALNGGQDLESFYREYSAPDFSSIDIKKPENQRRVIREYFKQTTPYTDERIDKMIARLEEDGELESEALQTIEDLQDLREQRKAKYLKEQQEQERELRAENERKTNELVNAINTSNFIHQQRRDKVRAFFFNPIKVNDQVTTGFNEALRAIRANPEHQAQLADILLDYDPRNGISLERIEKRVKSKATSDFKSKLGRVTNPKLTTPSSSGKNKQSDDNFLSK